MNYKKLEEWRMANSALAVLKEREMRLRLEVFKEFTDLKEGTNTLPLQHGWKLKANYPLVRKLDQKKMPDVLKELKKLKAPPELIKTKYELSVGQYRKLDAECKAIIESVLTTEPGCPSLELVPPPQEK